MSGRVVDRHCTGCGAPFRGTNRRCRACRVVERTCTDCGRRFPSADHRRCSTCRQAPEPAEAVAS